MKAFFTHQTNNGNLPNPTIIASSSGSNRLQNRFHESFHTASPITGLYLNQIASTKPGAIRKFLQRLPDASFLFGAIFGDSVLVGSGECGLEGSGVKIVAVGRRSGLLPPGVAEVSIVDWIEA